MDLQQTGSEKWHPSAWKQLLEMVLPALEELPKDLTWTLGGGTALTISFHHRISYDIDIFFQDANALKLLSPYRNKKIRRLSDNWQQPGHYLKIERPEGDIDFLITQTFTEHPFFPYDFGRKQIYAETPAEIITKKIYYRGSLFTVRDIFDLAVFSESDYAHLLTSVTDIQDALPRVLDRIKRLHRRYDHMIRDMIIPTEFGKKFLGSGADIAINFLESVMKKIKGGA